jgi:UDP-N-acetylmuramate--alanine ligase
MELFDSTDRRPVHFMGIGGAGMSALALLACRRGVAVTGCDTDLSGTADVAALGAGVLAGHDPAHVAGARALVVTAAVRRDHPELLRAEQLGIPVIPRKQALGELVAGRPTVAVAGTHGKTTTTVMTTMALAAAGLEPTGLAGGRVGAWGGNARIGGDELFVIEADEYDQAFLALHPTVAIVNNVEPDHLECYGSFAALEDAFHTFASRAERVLVGTDDAGARRLAERIGAKAWRFGVEGGDLPIRNVIVGPEGTVATVGVPGHGEVTLRLQVPGLHNLRNAVAALGAAAALGVPLEPVLGGLERFAGVGRRFERLGQARGIEVVDDYAHHPSELVATLAAARQAYPGRRLVAIFQPHLFSRTAVHGDAMGRALAAADLAVVTDVYAAREQPMPGVSGRAVADAAKAAGVTTVYEPDRPSLGRRVLDAVMPGDLVLTLGAGDVTRVGPELLAALRES